MLLGEGCKTSSSIHEIDAINISNNSPQIQTIILRSTKGDKNNVIKFDVFKISTSNGFIKQKTYIQKEKRNGNYIFELKNKNGEIVQTEIFEDPLKKSYEYIDADGSFKRKEIELKEEYISIRTNSILDVSRINISYIINEQQIIIQQIVLK